ncbi:Vps54-like protein-domain-containing protein [Sporodiniella umbellata]|nr:Vps54-like protein-domain-containing protein [Sporodiniella umbellata]
MATSLSNLPPSESSSNSKSLPNKQAFEPSNYITSPANTNAPTIRPLARERPYAREEYNNSSSRPSSVRSGTSYGRTLGRLINGHHVRHHSNYSSFSTISESVLPWTTQDIGFNAISGVLNDPAKRAQDVHKPSKADIPSVTHVPISRIKADDFDTYMSHIGPVFERYHNNKLLTKSAPITLTEDEDESEEDRQRHRRAGRNPYSLPQHILSSESLLDDEPKTPPNDLPMLENVPAVFFEPEFLLENPRIFDTVCEGADIMENDGSVLTILQEKLSYYLDTVEIHLLQEIDNRSSSFFEALSNLQALHQQTIDCISQIHKIRQKMKRMQETECKDGLEVIRLQVRKRNLEELCRITEAVKKIKTVQPTIQALLNIGDYFAALDLIEGTKKALKDNDLKTIKALANYSSELEEMQRSVSVTMQDDFLSVVLSDFTYSIESTSSKEDLKAPNESDKVVLGDELTLTLTNDIKALDRTDTLIYTLQSYEERLIIEVKDKIRRTYPTSDTEAPEQSLTRHLKAMAFVSFFQILLDVFFILVQSIQRISAYHQLFVQILEKTPKLENKLKSILLSFAELAHVQCGKLIGSRSEQNALLNPTDFYRLSSVLELFIRKCESYCGPCIELQNILIHQQKLFLNHFHMERVKQETQLIENEQWAVSEVPSEFQAIVDRLCEGNFHELLNEDLNHCSDKESKKHLIIKEQSYYVVGCTLVILKTFQDYVKCTLKLQGVSAIVIQKLIELLKLFNSRVCQVILGAGAMQSAGLKNITAKHLALASQSIGVVTALVPKLKEYLIPYIPANQHGLISEFGRILKDYKNHQNEIHMKLVSIMNERFTAHVKAMQSIQWDEEEKEDDLDKRANIYMETLVTETVRLHKVLSKYLPIEDLKFIMSNVFESFTTQFSKEISDMHIKTEKGRNRLMKDMGFFVDRLNALQHTDPPSNAIIEAVNAISINV